MNVTAIKYRLLGENQIKMWRFLSAGGRFHNALVLRRELPDYLSLVDALRFGLTSESVTGIQEVVIQLMDHMGATWTLQKNANRTQYTRAGKVLADEIAAADFMAAWALSDEPTTLPASLLSAKNISWRRGAWSTTPWNLGPQWAESSKERTRRAAEEIQEQLKASLAHVSTSALRSLTANAGAMRQVHQEYLTVQQSIDMMQSVATSSTQDDVLSTAKTMTPFEDAENELYTLLEIEQIIPRVIEGHKFRLTLRKKLEEDEALIVSAHKSLGGQNIEKLLTCNKWQELIHIRALLDAHQRLMQQVATWQSKVTEAPASDTLHQLLATLRLTINQLWVDTVAHFPDTAGGDQQLTWFERLKGNRATQTPARIPLASPTLPTDLLAATMQKVQDAILELESHSATLCSGTAALSTAMQEYRRTLQMEQHTLAHEWQELCKGAAIAPTTGLPELRSLYHHVEVIRTGRIFREKAAAELMTECPWETRLKYLMSHWWKLIGSTKKIDLNNISLLVSEAKGSLRYKQERKRRLRLLSKSESRREIAAETLTTLQSRKKELEDLWADIGRKIEIATIPHLGDAEEFLTAATILARLDDLEQAKESTERLPLTDLLKRNGPELMLLHFDKSHPTTDALAILGSVFANCSQDLPMIIICAADLAATFHQKGFGEIISVPVRKGAEKLDHKEFDMDADESRERQKSGLSPRALRALDLLTPKRTGER